MVAEGGILLRIQRLQQSCGGVTSVVAAKLIYLVQQDKRILAAGLTYCVDNTSGHCADVGLSVTANLGFIMHAAQCYAGELAVKCSCDAHADGGLTGSGRTYKAEDIALSLGSDLLYCNELDNAFLYLFETVMVCVQNFSGLLNIYALLGLYVPGQLKAGIEVGTGNGGVGRVHSLLHQALEFLFKLLDYFLGSAAFGYLLAILIYLGIEITVVLTQLILNGADLLTQEVLSVTAHNASVSLFADFGFHNENIDLIFKNTIELFKALYNPGLFENALLVAVLQEKILGKVVGYVAGAYLTADIGNKVAIGGRRKLNIFIYQTAGMADKSLNLFAAGGGFKFGDLADICYEIGECLHCGLNAGAAKTLYEDAHTAAGQLEHLAHVAYGTDNIEFLRLGIFHVYVDLCQQEYASVRAHSSLKGSHGFGALYVKIQNGVGEG